jgi:hypothetical protein
MDFAFDSAWSGCSIDSGLARSLADGCETRFLISFGPFDLAPGETEKLAFIVAVIDSFHTPYSSGCDFNYHYLKDRAVQLTDFFSTVSHIGETNNLTPSDFEISVFPNPFNSSVRISVGQTGMSNLRAVRQTGMSNERAVPIIEIFDISGKKVFTEFVGAGLKPARAGGSQTLPYKTVWRPAPSISSGIYLIRAKIGNSETTKRVVYLK